MAAIFEKPIPPYWNNNITYGLNVFCSEFMGYKSLVLTPKSRLFIDALELI